MLPFDCDNNLLCACNFNIIIIVAVLFSSSTQQSIASDQAKEIEIEIKMRSILCPVVRCLICSRTITKTEEKKIYRVEAESRRE